MTQVIADDEWIWPTHCGRNKKKGTRRCPKGERSGIRCSVVIGAFAMGSQVEAFALFLFRNPQTDDHIDQLVGNH